MVRANRIEARRLLLALLLAAPAAALAQPQKLEVPYTQFTLPNGLHVIVHEDHNVPIVSVNTFHDVGSARERPGHTGFAHLFEHLMFMGSAHVPYGEFDSLLENVGGSNNASTGNDSTDYFIDVPSNALELALYLESDRLGYLLPAMTPAAVDAQRDVVKNERRERVDNQPYGTADLTIDELMYPPDHPYHWPVIGYMQDLTAASHRDVIDFFKKYYTPANTTLAIAGDVKADDARRLVEKWFGDVPAGPAPEPLTIPGVALDGVKSRTITDRVQLARLYLAWPTPRLLEPGDASMDVVASVLTDGKNSRLYKRLVYDMQIAQNVTAYQASAQLSSKFVIIATPRRGRTVDELKTVIDEEIAKLAAAPPSAREVERAVNQFEASFYDSIESIRRVADRLNSYYALTGDPDWFNEDLSRYRALSPSDVSAAAAKYLPKDRRVEVVVVPQSGS